MSLSRQLSVFLFIGGVCTALHYAILILLVQLKWSAPVVASALGFSVSAVLNYLLNRTLTFGSTRTHRAAFPRFVGVAATGLALNTALLALLHGVFDWHYLPAQFLATGATLIWNFVLHKVWTFANRKGEPINAREGGV